MRPLRMLGWKRRGKSTFATVIPFMGHLRGGNLHNPKCVEDGVMFCWLTRWRRLALRSGLAGLACPPGVALLPGLALIAGCASLSLTTRLPGLARLASLPGGALRSCWRAYIATTNKQQERKCH